MVFNLKTKEVFRRVHISVVPFMWQNKIKNLTHVSHVLDVRTSRRLHTKCQDKGRRETWRGDSLNGICNDSFVSCLAFEVFAV